MKIIDIDFFPKKIVVGVNIRGIKRLTRLLTKEQSTFQKNIHDIIPPIFANLSAEDLLKKCLYVRYIYNMGSQMSQCDTIC